MPDPDQDLPRVHHLPQSFDAETIPTGGAEYSMRDRPGSPAFSPGEILAGRFRIVRFISQGGMGEVYEAEDSELGDAVALKTIRPHIAADAQIITRFKREIQLARQVTHPNVCRVFDLAYHRDPHREATFLTMELVRGETLSDYIVRRGRLAPSECLPLVEQMAAALEAAHRVGVVHRDFKSSNVMLDSQGPRQGLRAVVTDFGLARSLAAGSEVSATMTGAMLGTPAYMAPEQVEGTHSGPSVDIYALGVVIYEMVTGSFPFQAETPLAVAAMRLIEPPASPRRVVRDLDPTWEYVILRCLERDPASRFDTPLAVVSALRPGAKRPRSRWVAICAATMLVLALAFIFRDTLLRTNPSPAIESTAPSTQARPLHELLAEGRKHFERPDVAASLQKSTEVFRDAVRQFPFAAPAHAALAISLLRNSVTKPGSKDFAEARAAADRAVSLDPHLALAHVASAAAFSAEGKTREYESAIAKALELDPSNPEASLTQGRVLYNRRDYNGSIAAYSKALSSRPDWLDVRIGLGTAYHQTGQYKEAEIHLMEALRIAPDSSTVRQNLGAMYYLQGRYDEAAREFQKALEIRPSAPIYANLGTLYFFRGMYPLAAATFEKAIELRPELPLYWGNLADAYRWIPGSQSKAQSAYAKAIALSRDGLKARPEDIDIRSRLAVYLAKSGDHRGALEECRLVQQAPGGKGAPLLYRLVIAYEVAGDRTAALKALAAASEAGHSRDETMKDPELAALRKDPRFRRLPSRQ